jgi:hypothetical protein
METSVQFDEAAVAFSIDKYLKKISTTSIPTPVASLADLLDEDSKFVLNEPLKKDKAIELFYANWVVENMLKQGLVKKSEEFGEKGVVIDEPGRECIRLGGYREYLKIHPKSISYEVKPAKATKAAAAIILIVLTIFLGFFAVVFFIFLKG